MVTERGNDRKTPLWTDESVAKMQIYANAANEGADVRGLPRQLLASGFRLRQIRAFRDSAREIGHTAAVRTLEHNLALVAQDEIHIPDVFTFAAARALGDSPEEARKRVHQPRIDRLLESAEAVARMERQELVMR